VLLALTERGIKLDFVAGCSMGAMVGAAFAAGRIEQLETWALSLDWKRVVGLLDLGLRGGLLKATACSMCFRVISWNANFRNCQCRLQRSPPISRLERSFGCERARSQMPFALPVLFRDCSGRYLRDGRYLVDGSVVNPIPISLCRAMGAEVVIAVDLGSHLGRRFPGDAKEVSKTTPQWRRFFNVLGPSTRDEIPPTPSIVDTMLGAIDVMQERIARARLVLEAPEVMIAPRLGQLGQYEYHRAALAIAEGREAATQMLPAIRQAMI
jgi:NTE family protein